MKVPPSLKVFRSFISLSPPEQDDFVSLAARSDQANAIRNLFDEIAVESMDGMIAMQDAGKLGLLAENLQRAIERRTAKPRNKPRDAEIIRLRDIEEQSFGQIAKAVGLGSESAARTAYSREKKRQSKRRK